MNGIESAAPLAVCSRVMQIFFGSFIYIYLIAKLVGPENKAAWFRKRKKYTFFNRRGIFGEDINFGYPICVKGVLVFIAIYAVIFGFGYWYIFVKAY